ncbi:MAG: hypothetical protein WD355_05195 [Balneolaceae bacterium]
MTPAQNRKNRKGRKSEQKPMLFSAVNYRWMGAGVLLVIIGFTMMYLENEVRGFISLYVSPILILGGYMVVLAAILKKSNPPADGQLSSE